MSKPNPHRFIFGLKGAATISCGPSPIDTQGKSRYTSAREKGVLINFFYVVRIKYHTGAPVFKIYTTIQQKCNEIGRMVPFVVVSYALL